MDDQKIRYNRAAEKRPEENAPADGGPSGKPFGLFALVRMIQAVFQASALLLLVFSLRNISDILRHFPETNGLPPVFAYLLSYAVIQVFCVYGWIVVLGSGSAFLRRIGPTLIEWKGLLLQLLFVPLVFVLVSGAVLLGASRIPVLETVTRPFRFLPDFFSGLYDTGWPFWAYALLSGLLPVVAAVPALLMQIAVRKTRPSRSSRPAV